MIGHNAIKLIDQNCTSCMICVRECPTWCITLSAHLAPDPESPPGRRPRMVHVLDEFSIDWALCMYCGICVAECPFGALEWAAVHVPAVRMRAELRHYRGQLGEAVCR